MAEESLGRAAHWKTVLVTGGAGFIGSNFLNLVVPEHPDILFVNLDKLTYAGNLANVNSISHCANYKFVRVDIADYEAVQAAFAKFSPDAVIHFAAESHVDRSIKSPRAFLESNVLGTFNLLEASREAWVDNSPGHLFHHVSTDEVYGALGDEGYFVEDTAYDPSSPYSASKASSDHLVRAWNRTFGLPSTISNCSNNYGPRQFPEKLIPLMILNAGEGKPLPVYGKGLNVRDWLYVDDHCHAVWKIATQGEPGETYNVGGSNEVANIEVVEMICDLLDKKFQKRSGSLRDLITYVADRPGHDFRYAIDASKIQEKLHWTPLETFETGMEKTVQWYLDNPVWIDQVRSGEYRNWVAENYASR
jgi:dTDP-glucose 4,6-dehydratase